MFKNNKKLIFISSICLASFVPFLVVACNSANKLKTDKNKKIDLYEKPIVSTSIEFIKNNNLLSRWYQEDNTDVYY